MSNLAFIEEFEREYTNSDRVSCPAPRALADKLLREKYALRTLQWYQREWWVYDQKDGWYVIDNEVLDAIISEAMADWWYLKKTKDGEEQHLIFPLICNSRLTSIQTQLRRPGRSIIPATASIPMWLDDRANADDYLAVGNGLLHKPSRSLQPHTPLFFTPHRLPFDHIKDAPKPKRWLQLMTEQWPDDPDSILLLQMWFGYLLTGDTRYHKMLLLVGKKRTSKGTIARVLTALLGQHSCCSPTLSGLTGPFGLECIINKRLAVIGDARLSGRADSAIVVERLLSASGGDMQTIPRKNRKDWVGTPETRFMLLSNELPNLRDSSGALASRFLILQTSTSFYGNEDHDLDAKLLEELPGIFNWALDGLDALNAAGRFPEVATSADLMKDLEDLSSPVAAFVRDRCEIQPGFATPTSALYAAWKEWCHDQGIEHISPANIFGRDFAAAFPECKKVVFRSGGRREKNYQGIRVL